MKKSRWFGIKGLILLAGTASFLWQEDQSSLQDPIQFHFKRSDLSKVKKSIQSGDPEFLTAARELKNEAEEALSNGPWTVADKKQIPPSGNKHDYMSNAKYWWPDPSDPDAPYLRKDGVTNPHTQTSDKDDLGDISDAVETLGLAYYIFDEERYAKKAAEILRVWFLNKDTYMSPHMQFGQAIPNRIEGRPFGIIETRRLIQVLDGLQFLRGSEYWTESDQKGIEDWFQSYLDWLLNSDHGRQEGSNGNNHETAYTFQTASYALFTGNIEAARQQLDNHFKERIIQMIEPDGGQPRELARTKSLHYSSMNLSLMIHLCQLAEYLNIDLWHYETPDGRSIQKAFDFLYPVWSGEKQWEYEQIETSVPDYDELFHILRVMRIKFGREEYETTLKKIYGDRYEDHRGHIYWPIFKEDD